MISQVYVMHLDFVIFYFWILHRCGLGSRQATGNRGGRRCTTKEDAKPTKGSTVAIFGLGTVGLAAVEGARIAVHQGLLALILT